METFSAEFARALGPAGSVVALRQRSQLHLLWWWPYACVRGWWLGRSVDVIHLGDGALAWLGVVLQWLTHKPVTVTLHGLDVTYHRYGYQRMIWPALYKLRGLVCVSPATAAIVQQHLPTKPVQVIGHGIRIDDWPLNQAVGNNRCLLFVGRLIERKGCAWFIAKVLPQLADVHLHVVGSGPELAHCRQLVQALHLTERVRFHGQVNNQTLRQHYTAAQALIMPNLFLAGDIEGFGLVALEASACGLPVLAANLEGLAAAVIDGQTGFLLESGNAAAWIAAIERNFVQPLQPAMIRKTVQQHYSWPTVIKQYRAVMFNELI
ncbi:MAG: glycosyltransferase family 4 protein [Candidatus Kerfeldbacteria bacterium]|nr:glycosyltransferase family 4 protein [Candidatus Kerfeldbacteria bacterium]